MKRSYCMVQYKECMFKERVHAMDVINNTGTCFVPGCQIFPILKLYLKSKE